MSDQSKHAAHPSIWPGSGATIASAFDLRGTVALVTGSTAGIGFGIARVLGEAGARVVVTSRRADAVERACTEMSADSIEVSGRACDVRDPDQVDVLINHTIDTFGQLDILVNCAGGSFGDAYRSGPLSQMQPDDFLECYRSNVVSAFVTSSAALPHLRVSAQASIVNVASMAPYGSVSRGMGAYAASKAAMITLTRTMAAEWAPTVRVNAVAPGHIDTPRTTAARSPELMQRLQTDIALGRLGTPSDVGACVLYLAAPAAGWVTGTVIQADGGETLN